MFNNIKKRWNNFLLCIKYPIIIPRTIPKGRMNTNFFKYTWLDYFPKGWRKLGLEFFKELQTALNKLPKDSRKSFHIYDIKEKYGQLCIYPNWYLEDISYIITKYEKLSKKTCLYCGGKARWLTKGYIVPVCNHCKKELKHKYKFNSMYKKSKKKGNRQWKTR